MKVEKHVSIPDSKIGRKPLYPFASMEVGDSFGPLDAYTRDLVRASSTHYCKRHGGRFKILKVGPAEWRCWRTE